MKKNKKHTNIVNDYKKSKSKHLDKLAAKILEDEEKNKLLKSKQINLDFLKNF